MMIMIDFEDSCRAYIMTSTFAIAAYRPIYVCRQLD